MTLWCRRLLAKNFRCDVAQCPCRCVEQIGRVRLARKSKIDNLRKEDQQIAFIDKWKEIAKYFETLRSIVLNDEHNIFWLEIAMRNVIHVQITHSIQNLFFKISDQTRKGRHESVRDTFRIISLTSSSPKVRRRQISSKSSWPSHASITSCKCSGVKNTS